GHVDVLDDPVGLRERIQRYPHPAAGPGRGPSEHGRLLGDDHLETVICGRHRSRQSGGARTDHQKIAVEDTPLLARRHDSRSVLTLLEASVARCTMQRPTLNQSEIKMQSISI